MCSQSLWVLLRKKLEQSLLNTYLKKYTFIAQFFHIYAFLYPMYDKSIYKKYDPLIVIVSLEYNYMSSTEILLYNIRRCIIGRFLHPQDSQ